MLSNQSKVIAYFGPDGSDPAVRRRVAQWRDCGFTVLAFAFSRHRRASPQPAGWFNLGYVTPQSRVGRLLALMLACLRIMLLHRRIGEARLIAARNLDNLFLALVARRFSGSRVPLIYEVLDVNISCTAWNWRGWMLRIVEKTLLSHIDLLVVSSPAFIEHYYRGRLGYKGEWFLFENKVPRYAHFAPLPERSRPELPHPEARRRWRIGWFGYLDDEGSWHALRNLAAALPDKVEIHVRGLPYTNFDMAGFLEDIANLPNVTYGGGFINPDDLPVMYAGVDLVWSIDCNDLTANSKWLLTNSVYEAGYFNRPVLALRDTAVGTMVADFGLGWCLHDPLDENLRDLMTRLSPEEHARVLANMARLPRELFAETHEIAALWALVDPKVERDPLPLAEHPRLPAV